MNARAEGKHYPEVTFRVDPARVAAFGHVFGLATGVPPTFSTAAEFAVFPDIVGDPELGLDYRRVVHEAQEYTHHRPLVEGERLTIRSRLESIRVKAGNGFLRIVTELVGADGEVACTARSTMIERGGGS
jgi:acyl-CoA thioesterase FadM